MLRFADREIDRALSRLVLGKQLGEANERRAAVGGANRRGPGVRFGFHHGHAHDTIPAARDDHRGRKLRLDKPSACSQALDQNRPPDDR